MRDDHNTQESVTGACLAASEGESRVAGRGGGRRNKQKGRRVMGSCRCVATRGKELEKDGVERVMLRHEEV